MRIWGGAPGAARSHLSSCDLSDLEDLGFRSALMNQDRLSLPATSPPSPSSAHGNTHTHTEVEMQVQGCWIDPLGDCKAQPSLGQSPRQGGAMARGMQDESDTLPGTGKSGRKAGVSRTQINCREGAFMEEGEVS